MTTASPRTAMAALERLATALGSGELATILVAGPGRPPRLSVVSRHSYAAVEVYADDVAYWWGWAERISSADDPLAAAHRVATMVRTAPSPGDGW